jgi:hypothetical protein
MVFSKRLHQDHDQSLISLLGSLIFSWVGKPIQQFLGASLMGLDQYAYRIKAGILNDNDQIDLCSNLFHDGNPLPGVDTKFAYWRKFNALHGWMEQLYRSKGGTKEFNCTTVRLIPDDIARLESMALAKALVPVAGFFFGDSESPFSDEDKDEVLEFVSKAKEALASGDAVAYDSWW